MSALRNLGTVASLQEYLSLVLDRSQEPGEGWVYRGHREDGWLPVPKIDRLEYSQYRREKGWDRLQHEGWLLKEFMKAARPHVSIEPQDKWEWLGIAQHYGLATRLLDWTANPIIALFFAVEKPNNGDKSAVWCYKHKGQSSTSFPDPFQIPELVFYDPPHLSSRVPAQAGCFTAYPTGDGGNHDAWPGSVRRVKISGIARSTVRAELIHIGINRASLFPDLDGIALHTNRRFSSRGDGGEHVG
jgi:hypothetical protein